MLMEVRNTHPTLFVPVGRCSLPHTAHVFNYVFPSDCPALRRDSAGRVVDPFAPGWYIADVTAVFKRFFDGYCELQVLLRAGSLATSDHSRRAWELLLQVVNFVLERPFPDLHSLKSVLHDQVREPSKHHCSALIHTHMYKHSVAHF